MEQKRLKYTIKIFGEGLTEYAYFEHLRTTNKFDFTVVPDMPENSKSCYKKRLKLIDIELKKKQQERADAIFLITDLDCINSKPAELKKYQDKKRAYKAKGVIFIESHPCIELWFWYHFHTKFSASSFSTYDDVTRQLKKCLPSYEKTHKYYANNKDFRDQVISKLDNRRNAIGNGLKSCKRECIEGEIHNFSEMFKAIHYFRLLKKFCELNSILKEKLRIPLALLLEINDHQKLKICFGGEELCTFQYDDKGALSLLCQNKTWTIDDTQPLDYRAEYVEILSSLLILFDSGFTRQEH